MTPEALKAHKRRQNEERLAWSEAWADSGLVFVREGAAPIDPELISNWFDSAAKAADLPRVRLHDLRHAYAASALGPGCR